MKETFLLYGILDTSTGKLVNNITNPRHKFWENKKRAENALNNYRPTRVIDSYRIHNGVRDKENLKVVEIKCEVQE